MAYEVSSRVCADTYRKAFADPDKSQSAYWLIRLCDPNEPGELVKMPKEWEQNMQSGGKPSTPTAPGGHFFPSAASHVGR